MNEQITDTKVDSEFVEVEVQQEHLSNQIEKPHQRAGRWICFLFTGGLLVPVLMFMVVYRLATSAMLNATGSSDVKLIVVTALVTCFAYCLPVWRAIRSAHTYRKDLLEEANLLETTRSNARTLLASIVYNERPLGENIRPEEFYGDVPVKKGRSQFALVRLIQNFCSESQGFRFPPVASTTKIYQRELASRLPDIKVNQTIALRLGILGTFLGLLFAMIRISPLFSSQVDAVSEIAVVLPVIAFSLTTSAAGLIAALFIQLILDGLLKLVRDLQAGFEDVAGQVFEALIKTQANESVLSAVDKLGVDLEEHATTLKVHYEQSKEDLDQVVDAIEEDSETTGRILNAIELSSQTLSDLEDSYQKRVTTIGNSLAHLEELEKRFASALTQELDQALAVHSKQIQQLAKDNSDVLLQITETLQDLLGKQHAASEALLASAELQSDAAVQAKTAWERQNSSINKVSEYLNTFVNKLQANFSEGQKEVKFVDRSSKLNWPMWILVGVLSIVSIRSCTLLNKIAENVQ